MNTTPAKPHRIAIAWVKVFVAEVLFLPTSDPMPHPNDCTMPGRYERDTTGLALRRSISQKTCAGTVLTTTAALNQISMVRDSKRSR